MCMSGSPGRKARPGEPPETNPDDGLTESCADGLTDGQADGFAWSCRSRWIVAKYNSIRVAAGGQTVGVGVDGNGDVGA